MTKEQLLERYGLAQLTLEGLVSQAEQVKAEMQKIKNELVKMSQVEKVVDESNDEPKKTEEKENDKICSTSEEYTKTDKTDEKETKEKVS